jgi:Ferredoxin-like domain in Api92-like protein
MPNHCTNLLSCTSGKTIGSIIKPYLTDDGKSIDFNKILPMPEGIKKLNAMSTNEELTKQRTPEEQQERDALIESLKEQNKKETGHESWYEWCVANWDTKWDSYNCYTLELSVYELLNTIDSISDIGFQTAWSPPINVIRELAKLTGESLRMSYYDEGWMFGGEYLVNADGSETDNCYEDIDDCPEHLKEELDVQYFLDCQEENEDDEEE